MSKFLFLLISVMFESCYLYLERLSLNGLSFSFSHLPHPKAYSVFLYQPGDCVKQSLELQFAAFFKLNCMQFTSGTTCREVRASWDVLPLSYRTKSRNYVRKKTRQKHGVWIKILKKFCRATRLARQRFKRRASSRQTKFINDINEFWRDCVPTGS